MAKITPPAIDPDLTPRTPTEIESIVARVQTFLDAASRNKRLEFKLKVDGYFQEDNWLNIVVVPVSQKVRAYQYAQALTDIDQELWRAGIPNILLVPARGD